MKICEGCIKQDVCKFKDEVEKYEKKAELPESLEPIIACKYRELETVDIPTVWTSGTVYNPDVWTYTTVDPCWTNS